MKHYFAHIVLFIVVENFTINRVPPRVIFLNCEDRRFKLSMAYVITDKQWVSHRKSLVISEALGHLLRIPFTDANKLCLIILVSTLKYLPPSTYKPKYLFWLAYNRGIPDKNNVDAFISYLGPVIRQFDFL